jgi:fructose-1,6-bisphosphatase/sedoheptulose 1,7-bisphosphatase-like protein
MEKVPFESYTGANFGGHMKSQTQNQGELKELKVNVEKDVVETFERMSKVSGIALADLVVIALKRFRSSHAEYEGKTPKLD